MRLCAATGPAGRTCQRWPQPAAHSDGWHQSDAYRWPYAPPAVPEVEPGAGRWQVSDRADPVAVALADRHYNRQSPGSDQFVPPGRCVVLRTATGDAVWVTSWPYAQFVKHAWAGAWVCSIFRNESPHLSSALITEAVAATLAVWPEPPVLGMVTFVDEEKTRRKRDPGRCFRRAGFQPVGHTKGGLVALQLLPADMPEPSPPGGFQASLLDGLEGASA